MKAPGEVRIQPEGDSVQNDKGNKSNEQLDKGKNVTGILTRSWNNASAGKNPVDSWGKGKDGASGGSTWGKAAKKLTSNDGSGGSKTNWDSSIATPDNQTGSWGNTGRSSVQPEIEASGWKKATNADGGKSENWGNMKKDGGQGKGGLPWGNATETQDRDTYKGIREDSWGKAATEKWSGKDGSGGSKTVWNSSGAATTENQTRGTWGSVARPSA